MTSREHLAAARAALRSFHQHLNAAAAAEGLATQPYDMLKLEGPILLTETVIHAREEGLGPDEIMELLKRALKGEGG